MKKFLILLLIVLPLFILTCSRQGFDNPFNPGKNQSLFSGSLNRLLDGTATAKDLQAVIQKYNQTKNDEITGAGDNPNAVISMPYSGKLLVTLRDNDAGWRSEVYMKVNEDTTLLFSDTRQGPLNVTTEFPYAKDTPIEFFLVTHSPNGVYTNNANSSMCHVVYDSNAIKWTLSFEDNPDGDWDFNDAVIEVQMSPDSFIDLSDKLNVSIDYLNPHGYNEEGYAIYYIGESMSYKVNINVIEDDSAFDKDFTVYVIHEYLDDETCDRWWYPSPPRPADEPQEISVSKGDPLPGQDSVAKWDGVQFVDGQTVTLTGSYSCPLSVAAGNDQTHVIIVHENDNGQIELTIYDNPEAGVFDPPANSQ